MAGQDHPDDPYSVSAEDLRGWLKREIADIAKAQELRISDATAFVEAYSQGQISAQELQDRMYEYSCRWGEPCRAYSVHKACLINRFSRR